MKLSTARKLRYFGLTVLFAGMMFQIEAMAQSQIGIEGLKANMTIQQVQSFLFVRGVSSDIKSQNPSEDNGDKLDFLITDPATKGTIDVSIRFKYNKGMRLDPVIFYSSGAAAENQFETWLQRLPISERQVKIQENSSAPYAIACISPSLRIHLARYGDNSFLKFYTGPEFIEECRSD
jgi:hypothetical protein